MTRASGADGVVTVLNVNDREQSRYVVTKMLTNVGFRVREAATGLEALAMARAEQPTVMLLDVRLPDIDGVEVCRRLRADPATASILVVHTSATYVSAESRVRGLETGGDAYLAQPFTAQELIATVRSLVRLKRVEEAQRRRADELARIDRRKDEFLAMLAHELRNPLAAVVTSQTLLERHPPRDHLEARAREVGQRQTRQLVRLVDDLLDVSRITLGKIALQRARLDLVALVRDAAATLGEHQARERRQRVELALPGAPMWVDGDRSRLEQVVTNLLDNASKYGGEGARIRVALATRDDGGERWAVLTVRDDGVGIPAEALESLFDLFYQAHATAARAQGGLGVGLSLVRGVVELHGGAVAARSDGPGQGSEFEVRLPLDEADAEARAEAGPREAGTAPAARATSVLIVEDNEDARASLRDLCELWGHQVEVACDGGEGVERALALRPDVALVDLGLPGIDGYEVARRIRAVDPGRALVLIALSGYGSSDQRAAALAAGFDLHLVKPADLGGLERLLRDPQAAQRAAAADLHGLAGELSG